VKPADHVRLIVQDGRGSWPQGIEAGGLALGPRDPLGVPEAARADRRNVSPNALRSVPSNRILSQSLDSLFLRLNLFQFRFDFVNLLLPGELARLRQT
jgi:hypothetical protein